jgi:hypothetical protein
VYFVTMKTPGYCLFSTTPSERFAIGLADDQQRVHMLAKGPDGWRVAYEWPVAEHSHTDLMIRLGDVAEPGTVEELAKLATGS